MSTLKIQKENDNFNIVSDGKILLNNYDVTNINNTIYPVGSIYITTDDTEPASLFGGTWTKIQDKFLLASGSTYSNGSSGGSADAVVVSHSHFIVDLANRKIGFGNGQTSTSWSKINNFTQATNIGQQIYTDTRGESGTGKNMPPYLVVNIWERIP